MLVLRRKHKLFITALVCAVVIISTPFTDYRLHEKFVSSRSRSPFFPTTSSSENINFKNLEYGVEQRVDDLRLQLDYYFPYDSKAKIPKRIWQTWRDDLNSMVFPPTLKIYFEQWEKAARTDSEYSYDHVYLSDTEVVTLLESLYGVVPAVLEAYHAMPLPILKADFFRYLILYARGGIYSDMDTVPCKPLNYWPSTNPFLFKSFTNDNIRYGKHKELGGDTIPEPGLVVGIEADPDRPDWPEHYARRIQFCQWTIQSKPGHPLLRELILNITATTLYSTSERPNLSGKFTPIYDGEHIEDYDVNYRYRYSPREDKQLKAEKNGENTDGTDIMNWTGPGIFSDTVFQYLNNIIKTNKDIVIYNDNLREPDPNSINEYDKEETTIKFYEQISEALYSHTPKITWEFFSWMKSPILIDDIVILPITSFSPGVGHMGTKEADDELALVQHLFEGSWKPQSEEGL